MRFPLCMGYGTSDRWGLWASFHIDLYINLQNFKMAIGFYTQFVTRFSQFKSELHSKTQFKIIHILELNISGSITNGKPQCTGHLQFFFFSFGTLSDFKHQSRKHPVLPSVDYTCSCVRMRHSANFTISAHITPCFTL